MRTKKFSPFVKNHSPISTEKAKLILGEGLLHRNKLTENQRRYLSSIVTGGTPRGERQ